MLNYRIKGFILSENIISLTILTISLISLTEVYSINHQAINKYSEQENLSYCLREAARAKRKNVRLPNKFILDNKVYEIYYNQNKIISRNINSNEKMEISWNDD